MLINGRHQSMQFLINPWKWSCKSKQVENWAKKNAFHCFQDPVFFPAYDAYVASLFAGYGSWKNWSFSSFSSKLSGRGIEINWCDYVANYKNERKSRWVDGSTLKDLLNWTVEWLGIQRWKQVCRRANISFKAEHDLVLTCDFWMVYTF